MPKIDLGFLTQPCYRRGTAAMLAVSAVLAFGAWPAQTAAQGTKASVTAASANIPDFSGIWNKERGRVGAVKNLSPYPDMVMGDYKDPILQPWAAAQVKQHADMERAGTPPPEAKMTCWPAAVPNVLSLIGGVQVLQTPDTVVFLYGNNHQWRFVHVNREHSAHVTPSWFGESVGHYEGDTLVVDTIGIKSDPMSFVDDFGTPHTDDLHVIERYHLVDGGKTLQTDIMVDDPHAFTHKWTVNVTFTRGLNALNEGECAANNRLDVYGPSIGKMPEAKYHPPF